VLLEFSLLRVNFTSIFGVGL